MRPFENAGTVVRELNPYGYGDFKQVALAASVHWDSRDHPMAPRHGSRLDLEGSWVPALGDVTSSYSGVRGMAATYFTADDAPLTPALALRVGGEKLWGDVPYFAAAYVGGGHTLRGFEHRRFAGDAALYGGVEARFSLFDFVIPLPGEFGVFGLGDVGRVFLAGEDSDEWHTGVGGGVWVDWVDSYAFSVAVAESEERRVIYFAMGFPF